MPEGDSIFNLAARLKPLVGRAITSFSARKFSSADCATLVGRRILAVEARGKNLLIRLDDDRAIHIHLRMEGRVFFERTRSAFWKPVTTEPDMRLAVQGRAIIGQSLPVLRIVTKAQEKRSIDIGPDLCRPGWDEEEAIRRFRALDRASEIANALLTQRAVAGIGNVYKSEVLFLERTNPRTPLCDITDEALLGILRYAAKLLQQNLTPGPRTTRSSLVGNRLWVYNRAERPCFVCKTVIQRFRQGPSPGRSTYWCPECQRASTE
jgi:endonuclease-8